MGTAADDRGSEHEFVGRASPELGPIPQHESLQGSLDSRAAIYAMHKRQVQALIDTFTSMQQMQQALFDAFTSAQQKHLEQHRQSLEQLTRLQFKEFEAALQIPNDLQDSVVPSNNLEASSNSAAQGSLAQDQTSHVLRNSNPSGSFSTLGSAEKSSFSLDVTESEPNPGSEVTNLHDLFESLESQVKQSSVCYFCATLCGAECLFDRCSAMLRNIKFPLFIKRPSERIVHSSEFKHAIQLIIFVNAIFIAVSADNMMHRSLSGWNATPEGQRSSGPSEAEPLWLQIVHVFFAVVFMLEILLRIGAEEANFLLGDDVYWNLLDTSVVVSAWLEILLSDEGKGDISLLRLLRFFRVARSLRIVRLMKDFRELRLILISLLGAFLPLLWALSCIFMIIFVFAVFIQQGVAGFMSDALGGDSDAEALMEYFDSFGETCLTLFSTVLGGMEWGPIHKMLEKISPLYGSLFIAYICIMTLGVLNVITGIFCEGAIAKARSDRDLAMAEETAKNKELVVQLTDLFRNLDSDMSGTVSFEEWNKFTSKKEAKACLALLGLDVPRTKEMFRLIDIDESGETDLQEFVVGCMQLQGSSKTVDIETLLRNQHKLMAKFIIHMDHVEEAIASQLACMFKKLDVEVMAGQYVSI